MEKAEYIILRYCPKSSSWNVQRWYILQEHRGCHILVDPNSQDLFVLNTFLFPFSSEWSKDRQSLLRNCPFLKLDIHYKHTHTHIIRKQVRKFSFRNCNVPASPPAQIFEVFETVVLTFLCAILQWAIGMTLSLSFCKCSAGLIAEINVLCL